MVSSFSSSSTTSLQIYQERYLTITLTSMFWVQAAISVIVAFIICRGNSAALDTDNEALKPVVPDALGYVPFGPAMYLTDSR